MEDIIIKCAQPEDAEGILAVYAPYVRSTAVTFETEVPAIEEIRERIRTTLLKYPYLTAISQGKIIGYAYASAFHKRAAYQWTAESSVYVEMGCRRRGTGSKLYAKLEALLERQSVQNICACITYPNEDSIAFHEKLGYCNCAHFHRSGYKHGMWHDMVWMEKMIGPGGGKPEDFIPFPELPGEPRKADL